MKNTLSSRIPSLVLLSALWSSEVFAENGASENQSKNNQDRITEEVYVTGSRNPLSSASSTFPLLTIGAEDLSLTTKPLVADVLNRLPSAGAPLTSQTTTNFGFFAPGISSVDLRNLSPTRTLVLVNGRRYVGGDSERPNVVDLNSIPAAMVERIEVVTGGVSAVYGSEAVAGVVNIITKQDFTGTRIDVQWGQSSEGDGDEKSVSLTTGFDFSDNAGHVTLNLGYTELDEVYSRDRAFSANDEFLGDFQDYSVYTPQGTITADNANFFTAGDDGLWTAPFNVASDGFNRADYRLLSVPLTRESFVLNTDYAFSDQLNSFVEFGYTATDSFSQVEPTGAGAVFGHLLFSDHPSIPAEALTTLTEFYGELPGIVTFTRRLPELGPIRAEQERTTQRIAFGFDGEINGWLWDSYYQWGQNERKQTTQGNYNLVSFQSGLDIEADPDSEGAFRCLDAQARAEGCVPIDVFSSGGISDSVLNYIAIPSFDSSVIEQEVFSTTLRGQLENILPAGNIGLVTGFEWRQESLKSKADEFALAGVSSSNAIAAEIDEDYEVSEVYAELKLPIVSDSAGVKYFGADFAYRYADYTTVGTHGSWQLGVNLALDKLFSFRAMVSESVRAPNIVELYDPGVMTGIEFFDPCEVGGSGSTETNCSSLGIPTDYVSGPFGGFAPGLVSGNEDLEEETADTLSIGVSFAPVDALSVSFDYFDISIDNAIETVNPQIKLNQCYAADDFPDNDSCIGIVRGGVESNYLVSQLDIDLQNIGILETKGWDLAVNYNTDVMGGDLSMNLLVTRTIDWESTIYNEPFSKLDEPGYQKWKANTQLAYRKDAVTFTWATRYLGSGAVDNNFDTSIWPANEDLPSVWYHDYNVRFHLKDRASYTFIVGLNNATDKKPPYIPSPSFNNVSGSNTAAGVYDVVGRFFYVGAEVSF